MKYLLLIYGNQERCNTIPADLPHAEVPPVELWPNLHKVAADL